MTCETKSRFVWLRHPTPCGCPQRKGLRKCDTPSVALARASSAAASRGEGRRRQIGASGTAIPKATTARRAALVRRALVGSGKMRQTHGDSGAFVAPHPAAFLPSRDSVLAAEWLANSASFHGATSLVSRRRIQPAIGRFRRPAVRVFISSINPTIDCSSDSASSHVSGDHSCQTSA